MITNFTLKGICLLLLMYGTVENASARYHTNPPTREDYFINSNSPVTNNSINLAKFDNEDSIVAQGSPNACGQVISFTTSASGKWVHAKANNYSSQPAADSVNMIASIEDNANYGTFYASYYTSSATRLMPSGKPYLNRNINIVPATHI